jgi:hypothetical protein
MKSRSKEVKQVAQGHSIEKGPKWEINPCPYIKAHALPIILNTMKKNLARCWWLMLIILAT